MEDIPRLAIFVGPNGVGKTTILQSIAMLRDWVVGGSRSQPANMVSAGAERATIKARFELSDAELAFLSSSGQELPDARTLSAELTIPRRGEPTVITDQRLKYLLAAHTPDEGIGVVEYRSAGTGAIGNGVTSIGLEWSGARAARDEHRALDSDNRLETYRRLGNLVLKDLVHLSKTGDRLDSLAHVRELFSRLFPLKRLAEEEFVDGVGLKLMVDTDFGRHDLSGLSTGEQFVFSLLADLVIGGHRDSIILLDTPEAFLHPQLERTLTRELSALADENRQNNQILVATHSLEIIDAAPHDSIYSLRRRGGGQLDRVNKERDKLSVFASLGASMGVQLVSETVLFTEGTDFNSDKQLLLSIFPDWPETVTIVPAGFASDLPHTSNRALDLLKDGTKYSKFFSLRDRDYRSAAEVQRFKDRSPNLIVLNRNELENYLLDTDAICLAARKYGHTYNADNVHAALREIAREFFDKYLAAYAQESFRSSVNQIYVDPEKSNPLGSLAARIANTRERVLHKLDSFDELIKRQREAIEAKWSEDIWIQEFPGKELLALYVGRHIHRTDYRTFRNEVAQHLGQLDRSKAKSELRDLLGPVLAK